MDRMSGIFKFAGLSFKQTPIEIREKLALNEHECRKMLDFMKEFTEAEEALVLSTCNRTEIYYSSEEVLTEEIIKGIATIKGIPSSNIGQYFTDQNDAGDAVRHLFRVSMGLEAQVVGDIQISNQVKRAYQWSADVELAGPFLHRLMHTIFFTNKRVVQETPYRDGAASISYAAKELVEDLSSEIISPRILVLGLGEIGKDVCRNLQDSRFDSITIINRTHSKAREMAEECGFMTAPFENLEEEIDKADVIISSVSGKDPFITRQIVEKLDILTVKFFIDLSVPRSVDLHIEEIPGALVYNIDHISLKVSEAVERRLSAVPDVERIIEESLADFQSWSREMVVSPTIKKIKNALEEIRTRELEKYVRSATPEQAALIDKATRGMMQKIMKLPVLQLKAACQRGDADNLIDVLNDLFDLEKKNEKA